MFQSLTSIKGKVIHNKWETADKHLHWDIDFKEDKEDFHHRVTDFCPEREPYRHNLQVMALLWLGVWERTWILSGAFSLSPL